MYSGKFMRIGTAEEDTGISISKLIEIGYKGDLSIYGFGKKWVREDMKPPHNRYNIITPILMDDEVDLVALADGETITFLGNAEIPVVCYRGSTDDNYLDGVEVTQRNLYCLKSEIESIKNNQTKQTNELGDSARKLCESDDLSSQKEQLTIKPWLIPDPKDPEAQQAWYTPARFFARQLVMEDSRLLKNRNLLTPKIVKELTKKGIKKRGGKKPFSPDTILNALKNVTLE